MGHPRRLPNGYDKMKKLFNQAGMGLLEILIGISIAGVGSFLIMNGIDFLSQKKSVVDKSANLENMISGIIGSVRTNIVMEKIDFVPENFLNNTTYEAVEKSLKLCWVNDGLIPIEAYPNCPGKLGYVVTPFNVGGMEYRGLYKVTLRLTHSTLLPNQFREYVFIVKDP